MRKLKESRQGIFYTFDRGVLDVHESEVNYALKRKPKPSSIARYVSKEILNSKFRAAYHLAIGTATLVELMLLERSPQANIPREAYKHARQEEHDQTAQTVKYVNENGILPPKG